MVFKEAIEHKWMIAAQVPVLASQVENGKRRAAFTEDECDKVFDTLFNMIENSRKEKTKLIRGLLLHYMAFAVYIGICPGTEMEGIT